MNKNVKYNIYTYSVFLIIAGIGILYGNLVIDQHPNLRIWNINNILIMLLGIPFLFLQRQANIPDFWQKSVTNKNRFVIPFLIGLIFGLLDICVFKVILHPEPYEELPLFLQPFPYSVFLYFSGAFEIEVFYRLIPITIICLIGNWFKKGQYARQFFLFAAVLSSLREPLEQLSSGAFWLVTYSLLTGFAMNLFQALLYKKSGFLGSISLRLGHYFLWHILFGTYVEYLELG